MTKLEIFKKLEMFLRLFPEEKDKFIPLEDLATRVVEEQIEKYGLPNSCMTRITKIRT